MGTVQFSAGGFIPTVSSPTTSSKTVESGESAGACFVAPKTGYIDRIGCYCSAVTGTPEGIVRLRSVGAATRLPDTALSSQAFTPTATTMHWVTLGTPYEVTKGTRYAACVEYSSGSTSFDITSRLSHGAYVLNPWLVEEASSTWSVVAATSGPCVAARYSSASGGDIIKGCYPLVSSIYSTNINTGTSPDEVGTQWTPADAYQVEGFVLGTTLTANACAFDVILYEGTTSRRTLSFPAYSGAVISQPGWISGLFDTPFTVVPSTAHTLAIKPTVTSSVRVGHLTYGDADSCASQHGEFFRAERTDAGSWTQKTSEAVLIYPLIGTLPSTGSGMILNTGLSGGLQ